MVKINKSSNKELFNLALYNQKNKNFSVAINLYQKLIEINPNIALVYYNLGLIYEKLAKKDLAKKNYKQAIKIDGLFFYAYNNLGIISHQDGNKDKAIKYFEKVVEINSEYPNVYNNLGLVYASKGYYKEAIANYIKTLKFEAKSIIAKKSIIHLLTYYVPDNIHPIINANNNLRKLQNKFIFNDLLKVENLSLIFKKSYEIIKDIENNIDSLDFVETQAYRRNPIDLNCESHHKTFNKLDLIPKFCFSCFKIQIEPENVLDLIRLFFIFDSLNLSKNNQRKCMVEFRDEILGLYKGIIYCTSLEEAEIILENIRPLLQKHIKYKASIKRGCSEFYKSFPNFKKVNKTDVKFMSYPKEWSKLEKNQEAKKNLNTIKHSNTVSGLSISDFFVINQWLNYAEIINDMSYKEIGLRNFNKEFITQKLSNQINIRCNEFKNKL